MFDPVATTDNSNVIALLCVGDVSAADGNAALPLTLLFGQPMIHHMIKSLQAVGITKFVIGVDTVPGALLAYRDAVSKQGLDLRFVREPSAMTPLLEANSRILLLRADTILDVGLIQQALLHKDALVATVEERAENQVFERIDLKAGTWRRRYCAKRCKTASNHGRSSKLKFRPGISAVSRTR
jgi:hypothetical protein